MTALHLPVLSESIVRRAYDVEFMIPYQGCLFAAFANCQALLATDQQPPVSFRPETEIHIIV